MKKPPLLLTIGAAIALISGGAFAYWWLNRGGTTSSVLMGGEALPADTLMTISLSTDPEQWQRLRQFGTPTTQAWLDEQLIDWRDQLLVENDLEFATDIQPWVGDRVTIAVLPPDPEIAESEPTPETDAESDETDAELETESDESTESDELAEDETTLADPDVASEDDSNEPSEPDADELTIPLTDRQPTIVMLPIANPLAAQEVLASGAIEFADAEAVTYRDIEVRPIPSDAGERYAAVLDTKLVVLTTTTTAMEAVIDAYRGNTPLVNTAGLRPAFNQLQSPQPFAQVYINVPVATALSTPETDTLSSQQLSTLQDSQGLAIAATLEANGVYLEGLSWLSTDSDRTYPLVNNAQQIPSVLPANTVLMVSSGNLQQLWQDYAQNGGNQPPLSPLHPDNLRAQIQTLTGLDLEADLLSWMAGEAAFALVQAGVAPTESAGADPDANPEAVPEGESAEAPPTAPNAGAITPLLLFQASDRPQAETQLTALEDTLSDRYRFQIETSELAGTPISTWSSPFGALNIVQSWLPDDIALLTLGTDAAATVIPTPEPTLAADARFQAATARSAMPHNGHFYVNLAALLQRDVAFPLPQIPPKQLETLQAIEAIGVTASIADARTARYDIQVIIPSNREIAPLPQP